MPYLYFVVPARRYIWTPAELFLEGEFSWLHRAVANWTALPCGLALGFCNILHSLHNDGIFQNITHFKFEFGSLSLRVLKVERFAFHCLVLSQVRLTCMRKVSNVQIEVNFARATGQRRTATWECNQSQFSRVFILRKGAHASMAAAISCIIKLNNIYIYIIN